MVAGQYCAGRRSQFRLQPGLSVERFLQASAAAARRSGELSTGRRPASTSMTAEAMYCRLLFAETVRAESMDEAAAEEATQQLLSMPADASESICTTGITPRLALHHRPSADDESAAMRGKTWNEAMADDSFQRK